MRSISSPATPARSTAAFTAVAPKSVALASDRLPRSEEHTSELQSLMRISSAVLCLKKKKNESTQDQSKHKLRQIQTRQNRSALGIDIPFTHNNLPQQTDTTVAHIPHAHQSQNT